MANLTPTQRAQAENAARDGVKADRQRMADRVDAIRRANPGMSRAEASQRAWHQAANELGQNDT